MYRSRVYEYLMNMSQLRISLWAMHACELLRPSIGDVVPLEEQPADLGPVGTESDASSVLPSADGQCRPRGTTAPQPLVAMGVARDLLHLRVWVRVA